MSTPADCPRCQEPPVVELLLAGTPNQAYYIHCRGEHLGMVDTILEVAIKRWNREVDYVLTEEDYLRLY